MQQLSQNSGARPLKNSAWAMERFSYEPKQRSAFWQFCHANQVPMIRMGRRRIMFDDVAVESWLAKRSNTEAA